MFGAAFTDNVWFDCNAPAFAVDESAGTWTAVTDMVVSGTSYCDRNQGKAGGYVAATITKAVSAAEPPEHEIDFADVLLFPHVPLASATSVFHQAGAGGRCSSSLYGFPPSPARPLAVGALVWGPDACAGTLVVGVDQSAHSEASSFSVRRTH